MGKINDFFMEKNELTALVLTCDGRLQFEKILIGVNSSVG
jgi:hypothetical protein